MVRGIRADLGSDRNIHLFSRELTRSHIDTNSRYDQPASRGDQLLASLDYLTQSSSVRARVDSSRLAVVGHSMGGGGTLEAAKDRPSLQATVGLIPGTPTSPGPRSGPRR